MKGYAKVYREEMLSAIIGHGVRLDNAKDILKKGVQMYYDKYYTEQGGLLFKWWHRNKTPKDFVRSQLPAFGSWDEVLYKVLDKEENKEVVWWCCSSESDVNPLKALYETSTEYAWVDHEMAAFITKYKDYLEKIK